MGEIQVQSKIQEPGTSTHHCSPKYTIKYTYYFVDNESRNNFY